MAKCRQCDKPALVGELCIEHYRMYVEANYMLFCMGVSNLNLIGEEISAGTGGLMPPRRMQMPPPLPNRGDLTFSNINVDRSTIGAINTGTISNLNTSISIMKNAGQQDLAAAIKELTEAVLKSKEIDISVMNEINEQLEFLVAQGFTEKQNRSMGLVKSVLAGIRGIILMAPSLLTIWDRVEPLIKANLGIG